MVRGLYTAAAGMLTIEEQTATTANNLANIDTAGFKQDLLQFTALPGIHTWRLDDPTHTDLSGKPKPEYLGVMNAGTMDTKIWRDFDQGQPVQSGNPLDAAIAGDGFFVIDDGQGGEQYTRNGQFHLSADGTLVDSRGRAVQGLGGPIILPGAAEAYISGDGGVYSGGELAGQLRIVNFDDPQSQLSKKGDNAWTSSAPATNMELPQVMGGYYERSNADAVTCLTELIRYMRHYEAAQRVIVSEDSTLNIAANQIGRMPQ
jgi:flagellar basal-body rod protein FlgF